MVSISEGSKQYTKALLTSQAMTKGAKLGLSFRPGVYRGKDVNAKRVFAPDIATIILDFERIKGVPPAPEQLLLPGFEPEDVGVMREEGVAVCWYGTADGKKGYGREAFVYDKDGLHRHVVDAFGGIHNDIDPGFEEVNGLTYAKVRDEVIVKVGEGGLETVVEKQALCDIDGNLLTGKRYDMIRRYETALVENDVFLVREGTKHALMLADGSFIGGANGWQEVDEEGLNLKKFHGEVCLHARTGPGEADPKEKYLSWEAGEELYGGECHELKETEIEGEKCALAKNKNGEFLIYARRFVDKEGKHIPIYGKNLHTAIGRSNSIPVQSDSGELNQEKVLDIYDKVDDEVRLVVRDRQGNNHFGEYHYDPDRKGSTIMPIDQDKMARFLAEEKQEGLIGYWRFKKNSLDSWLAYGGKFETELQAGDPKADPSSYSTPVLECKKELRPGEKAITIPLVGRSGTIKKFTKDGRECYRSKDANKDNDYDLFGGSHDWQFSYIEWQGNMLVGFFDKEKGFGFFEEPGNEAFGGYHPKVKRPEMITMQTEGSREHPEIFLPVIEPVPFFSRRRFFGFRLRTPPTYYALKGQRFTSKKAVDDYLKQEYAHGGARLEKYRRSDSVRGIPAISNEQAAQILSRPVQKDPYIAELEAAELEKRRRAEEQEAKKSGRHSPPKTGEGA